MPVFFKKEFTLDRTARVFFSILILVAVVSVVRFVWPLLVPFVIAWVTATLLDPIVRFFQNKLKIKNRTIASLVVLVLIVAVISGVVAFLMPSITAEVKKAWVLTSNYFTPELFLSLVPSQYRGMVSEYMNMDSLISKVKLEQAIEYFQTAFQQGWTILSGTLSVLSEVTVVGLFALYLFFILSSYEGINKGAMKMVPDSLKPLANRLGHDVEVYVSSYFRGQGLIALICGVFTAIGFWIMGMPLGLTMGMIMGLLNLIPYMQILGVPPIIVLCLLQSADTGQNAWILMLIAFAILGLCQMLQDFYLTPTIMGREMGMHPAAILLALSVWGFIWGFWGLIFALPLTMIIYDLYMDYVVGGKPLDAPFKGQGIKPILKKNNVVEPSK